MNNKDRKKELQRRALEELKGDFLKKENKVDKRTKGYGKRSYGSSK